MTLRDQGSLPLPPAVVEAAARALYARYLKEATFFQEFEEMAEGFEMEAEAALRAGLEAMGIERETRSHWNPDDQVLAYAKRQADRFRASLERIAFREECADVEAEDMRQAARAVLGWKTLGDRG